MEKKSYKKRYGWTQAAENALLEVWECNMEGFRGARKNGHVHKEISDALNQLGFMHNPKEVQTKINNMTSKFRKENCKIGPSGGSPSRWVYYERVKKIIGGFKSENIKQLQIESIDGK
ncbi:uncharacterized protein LOC119674576 [Teleopsis dalmanni]|uniref:uncharacterized protein LOC119674576 n=1 Tax=Teleopsis dalmanni TaxID=139649 RepID=UPI0018CD1BF4|nr:uncharacterized protein LOC119674576 [Teleopsis dalmanni]